METKKVCSKCNEEKFLNEFHKSSRSKDGLRGVCKKCTSKKETIRKYSKTTNEDTTKMCTVCKENLSIEDFSKISIKGKIYYQSSCKGCRNKFKVGKNKKLGIYRRRDIKNKYGITEDYFNKLIIIQDNKCKICGKEFKTNKAPCIDHCHATGKIRGLLCNNCNTGIGMLRDSTSILESAIKYLEENPPL